MNSYLTEQFNLFKEDYESGKLDKECYKQLLEELYDNESLSNILQQEADNLDLALTFYGYSFFKVVGKSLIGINKKDSTDVIGYVDWEDVEALADAELDEIALREKIRELIIAGVDKGADLQEDYLDETYSDEEIESFKDKTFNQRKILSIYRKTKYGQKQLWAKTRCIDCGREKNVFLSNLVKDPDKYGSCVCSDTNIESRLDNIEDLYSGEKKIASNTSGYTGVSFVKTYGGEPYNKWRAYIDIDGKRTYLGDFDSKSKAVKARKEAGDKGIKWYKQHKNEFMASTRKKTKRSRTRRRVKNRKK